LPLPTTFLPIDCFTGPVVWPSDTIPSFRQSHPRAFQKPFLRGSLPATFPYATLSSYEERREICGIFQHHSF
jgi:hypothetical protein